MHQILVRTIVLGLVAVAALSAPSHAQSVKAPTAVSVESSGNPVSSADAVTFTAKVVAVFPSPATPTGTVEFLDGPTSLGSAIVANEGGEIVASLTVEQLGVGAHPITARYLGDEGHALSVSRPLLQLIAPGP